MYMPGTDIAGTVENNPAVYDLAATGLSFQGGSVIISGIRHGGLNNEREILSHVAGTNIITHEDMTGVPNKAGTAYTDDPMFIVEHLNALDQPEEWYYTPTDNTLYLWVDDGNDPTGRVLLWHQS